MNEKRPELGNRFSPVGESFFYYYLFYPGEKVWEKCIINLSIEISFEIFYFVTASAGKSLLQLGGDKNGICIVNKVWRISKCNGNALRKANDPKHRAYLRVKERRN